MSGFGQGGTQSKLLHGRVKTRSLSSRVKPLSTQRVTMTMLMALRIVTP